MLADNAYVCYSTAMKARHYIVGGIILGVLSLLATAIVHFAALPVVLEPSGSVAIQQRNLFMFALIIMSTVAIPVFILLVIISWKYRAGNTKARYTPKWSSNRTLEAVWWVIPIMIVAVLSWVSWQSSHHLDPFTPIVSQKHTVKIQVVALQWKWLFIYPESSVASVNELYIPVNTPVEFSIASDAPMNSFWIPELGGQIYAMNGMDTKLHLIADKTGIFRGMSSNISGEGFADMNFLVYAVEEAVFMPTLMEKSNGKDSLTLTSYASLAEPNVLTEPQWYKAPDMTLFQSVIDKYALPHSVDPEYTDTIDKGGH